MNREPRRLAISLRLSVVELRTLVELAEELNIPHASGVASSPVRALLIRLISRFRPRYEEQAVDECLEWLRERGFQLEAADKNRRAIVSERAGEDKMPAPAEPAEIDLLAGLRGQELNGTTREEIEREAEEVGEQLDRIFAKLNPRRRSG